MRTNRLIAFAILALFENSAWSSEQRDTTLKAWVYNAYNSETTAHFFASYFSFDPQAPYSAIDITPSVDFSLNDCKSIKYGVIFAPESIATLIKKHCPYNITLQSTQQPKLWVLKNNQDLSAKEITQVGVLKNSPAAAIIRSELTKLNPDVTIKPYECGEELFFALMNGEINAMVINQQLVSVLSNAMSSSFVAIHSFESKPIASILVPQSLEREKLNYIIASLRNKQSRFFISNFE